METIQWQGYVQNYPEPYSHRAHGQKTETTPNPPCRFR